MLPPGTWEPRSQEEELQTALPTQGGVGSPQLGKKDLGFPSHCVVGEKPHAGLLYGAVGNPAARRRIPGCDPHLG